MSTNVTWDGVTYSIPAAGELNWGALSSFLVALGNKAAISEEMKQAVRVATSTPVTVSATTDFAIVTDLSVAGAVAVNLPAGVTGQLFAVVDGKGDAATNNITITPAAGLINGAATYVINGNRNGVIFVYNGTGWTILSEFIASGTTGSIPRSQIESGTADHVIINNGTGFLSSEAQLAITRGGTGASTATAAFNALSPTTTRGDLITQGATDDVRLAIGAANTVLKSDGTDPSWGSIANANIDASAAIAATKIADGSVDNTEFQKLGTAGTSGAGNLVTTDGTQSITSKDIDGATATNSSRITIPKASKSTLDGLTRKEGTIVYASDLDKLYSDNGTSLVEVGSGSAGEINLVENPSDAIGWSTTGANGPTGATTTTSGDLPLGGTIDTAIKMTSSTSAGAEASNYFSYSLSPGEALKERKLKVEFWMRPGSNFISGEWTVSIYSGSTRMPLSTDASGVTTIPSATGKFTTTFDADSSSSYTLRFSRPTNAGANAAVLNVASVVVGPGIQPQGAVATEWVSYTPTGGSWVSNTTYTGKYRRVGSQMEVYAKATLSGAPTAATLTFPIPTGFTIDTSVLLGSVANNSVLLGSATGRQGSGGYRLGVNYSSTSVVSVTYQSSTAAAASAVNATAPVTWANGDWIEASFTVPISEWSGSGTLNVANNDVEYVSNSSSTDADDTTSFVYGPSGSVGIFGTTALTASRRKRVRFQTPIQQTDTVAIEIFDSTSGTWSPVDANRSGSFGYQVQNTTESGMILIGVSSTDLDVYFGRYSYLNGATYGAAGQSWATDPTNTRKWRVKKSSGGQAVGFGNVAQNTSGLVKSAGQLLGTNTNDSAATGYVGEVVSLTSSGTSFTTSGQYTDLGGSSISLTAGNWQIFYQGFITAGTVNTGATVGIGTQSGNFATGLVDGDTAFDIDKTYASGERVPFSMSARVSISSTTPYYGKMRATYSGTVGTVKGKIYAIRIR